jgi:signal peptidase I
VDLSKSFFPVILAVLVLRSFIIEPFRIPSESMVPTLLKGDFILVNKFTYGLRLPVLNTRIFGNGDRNGAMWWCSAFRPSRRWLISSG